MKRQRYFNKQEMDEVRALIQEKTGYRIKSNNVLCQAFRRRSYCAEDGGKSNEMFEFIGDQVLSYYVIKAFSDRCASLNIEGDYSCRIRENRLSSLKQELVSNELLAEIIDEWAIANYLIVGLSDEKNRVDQQLKVKADLFESVIGAITIDSKWDPAVLEESVKKALSLDTRIQSIIDSEFCYMNIDLDNAVSILKELAEKEVCSIPRYKSFGPEYFGYDKDGRPIWNCECRITNDKTGICKMVFATSKKEAKKAASYLVLCEHFELQNKYGKNGQFNSWIYKDGKLIPDSKINRTFFYDWVDAEKTNNSSEQKNDHL